MRMLMVLTIFLAGCSTTSEFKFPKPPPELMKPPGKMVTV